ncbi:barstar family protein [Streptomyces sp. NPDC001002]
MEPTGHSTDFLVDGSFPAAMGRFVRRGRLRWPGLFVYGEPLSPAAAADWRLPEAEADDFASIVTFSSGLEMEDFWEENGYALDASGQGPYAVFYRLHAEPSHATTVSEYYVVSLVTPDDPAADPFSKAVVHDFVLSFREEGRRVAVAGKGRDREPGPVGTGATDRLLDVTGFSAPWVVCVPQGAAEIQRQLSAFEARGGRVHHFDARELTTEERIFGSFAEVLRFPAYFGRNWDALVDCLGDLCGAVTGGGIGIVGVISDADRLLEAEFFPLFVSVLCQGVDRANALVDLDGLTLDRAAAAVHFVLEFREFDAEAIELRIEQPDLVVIAGDGSVGAALDPVEWR